MKELIIKCPINHLSFGNISYNLLKAVYKKNINAYIFPVGNKVDLGVFDKTDQGFSEWLQNSISNRYSKLNRDVPFLNIWHISGAEERISDNCVLYTFHETSHSTEAEENICKLYNKVIFSSSYSFNIFNNTNNNYSFSNPGFDQDFYINNNYKLENKIHFGLMGKWEKRKNTAQIIKTWIKLFGNNHNYQLSCCVGNDFLSKETIDHLKHSVLEGRSITNINFLDFIPKNSQVNTYLNSIDIDLGGMSGAEGWNLPSFNATCLGKWSIVLNATAHKDWANESNSILVQPTGEEPIKDGIFFKKGADFNQGNKASFKQSDLEEAMLKAVNKIENNTINTEGIELSKKFTYEKTANNILKYFDL
jgi:hypothetical protein